MIIFTTDKINNLPLVSISSIVKYAGTSYCLAEVADSFNLTQEEVDKNDLGFWWEIDGGAYIDTEEWDYDEKYKGGIVEGIELVYSLTKESNIALVINTLANNAGLPPFELWEQSIENAGG